MLVLDIKDTLVVPVRYDVCQPRQLLSRDVLHIIDFTKVLNGGFPAYVGWGRFHGGCRASCWDNKCYKAPLHIKHIHLTYRSVHQSFGSGICIFPNLKPNQN